jgi:hypothetical protein
MSVRLGVVGCGNVSEIYLRNLRTLADIEARYYPKFCV